ncbi:HNH endonuclease [Basfia succiniciproducens]|uniref:HNH endonuclease n=1 Tax=Basfia succiniciproducens TaxID=653940 RepID=UPI0008CAE461|nr:HNH endonuclease [Basfia succiniciproducens]SEQ76821.1 HNH endonuclease [Basfia succiniciproducens]
MKNLSWRNNYIRGLGKHGQYNFIREQREAFVKVQVDKLKDEGAVILEQYPDYLILDNGDIYSTRCRRVTKLKAGTKSSGYRFVGLTDKDDNRKYEMVHRLVAKAFIPCNDFSLEVNHKDGNKNNNSAQNLEWVTRQENTQHMIHVLKSHKWSKKLKVEQVKSIYFAEGRYRDIGCSFGVSAQTVCNIKRKSHYRRELEMAGLL